ncbi:MAG: tyrosine-type recombinase/integrase [Dehalococcoidia bacterium]
MQTTRLRTITKVQATLPDALTRFLSHLQSSNCSPATVKAYETDITQLLTFLEETTIVCRTPQDITRADLAGYFSHLSALGLSGVSRARKHAALSAFFQFLLLEEIITISPLAGIPSPKWEKTGKTCLRPDEYSKLLSLAGANPRDYCFLQVFLQTGLRVSELCSVTRDSIDFEAHSLTVVGKGKQTRTIDLEKKAIAALKNYIDARPQAVSDLLFLNRYGDPISEGA